MFHSTPSSYAPSAEMTSVAANTAVSFHQTSNSTTASNAPVYVPSNRAIHTQYAGHAGNYANTQNGWSAESAFGGFNNFSSIYINYNLNFHLKTGSTHSPFYAAQNMMYMRAAYDPSGFQRTSPYGMGECKS